MVHEQIAVQVFGSTKDTYTSCGYTGLKYGGFYWK